MNQSGCKNHHSQRHDNRKEHETADEIAQVAHGGDVFLCMLCQDVLRHNRSSVVVIQVQNSEATGIRH